MADQRKDLRCYYAHSIMDYDTPREQEGLQTLRKLYKRVICPNIDIGDCSMGFQAYLNIVPWADVIVVSEYEGHVGGVTYRAVNIALKFGIPVFCLRYGKFLPVIDAEVVDSRDFQVGFAKLIIKE
jgi:hypothetical protein